MKKVIVNIATRDRPTELALLLNSLRVQTFQDFDIFILDDCGGTPLQTYHFFNCIVERLRAEGHCVDVERNNFNLGVSKNRQKLVDKSIEKKYEYILRVDDDVFLDCDYIEKLFLVINSGYDLASGVTPFAGTSHFRRSTNNIKPVGNKVVFDEKGNFVYNGDDCGIQYYEDEIIPLHHFRSCALYKTEIHNKLDYNSRLSKHGFREEQFFSFKMIIEGYKLGMHSQAIAWHLLTPSGGERFANQNELIKLNEEIFKDWAKKQFDEHGDFIKKYNDKIGVVVPFPTEEEQSGECNLVRL